jgi:hypothetical protein
MKDAVAILGKDDHVVPGLLHELTAPALPADGLSPTVLVRTWPPIGGRHGEQQPGAQARHSHGSGGVLGWMLQTPLLLALLAIAVLDETAVIIVISNGCQGLSTGALVRKTVLPAGP